MLRILRYQLDEEIEDLHHIKLLYIDDDGNARTLDRSVETENIAAWVTANESALIAAMADTAVNEELTRKFRRRQIAQRVPAWVRNPKIAEEYIGNNVTNLASAKEALKRIANVLAFCVLSIEEQDESVFIPARRSARQRTRALK